MKRFVFLILVGFLLAGCSLEYPSSDSVDVSRGPGCFSMSEAKELFERSVMCMESAPGGYLSPGDFTSQWPDARYTEVDGREYYDVPVIPTYRYEVFNSSFVRGRSIVRRDDVCQRLVVMKKSETSSGVYVASLIPASDNKVSLSVLRPCKLEGTGYSGMLVYSDVSSGSVVRVNVYESGRKVYGVYVPAIVGNEELFSRLTVRLNALELQRYTSLLTKMGGEIDESYCEGDGYIYESPYEDEQPPVEDPEEEEYYTGEELEPVNQGTSGPPPPAPPIANGLGSYPHIPKSTDKLARPDIPSTADLQVPNWCVYASMSYISIIFGANYGQWNYWQKFSEIKENDDTGADGVAPNDLGNFVNVCFYSTECNSRQEIFDALDSGEVVLVYVYVSVDTYHAVTIVGYADGGTFIYMDTEGGILYKENDSGQLYILAGYSISGYKKL